MNSLVFNPLPMDELEPTSLEGPVTEWIWHGMLARGNITLLTSLWKAGKTTLLAGLLRAMYAGDPFLDRRCSPAFAIVVSEESPKHWSSRVSQIPIGVHASLVSRPFVGRPTPAQWEELIRRAETVRAAGQLDVFVVDPLVTFLPGRSDSDPAALLDMLMPLRRLADLGVAILILHHPRKEPSDEGSTARGSGALLGYVDIIMELSRYGRLTTDQTRRRIACFSRHPETPESLVYEWDRDLTGEFRVVGDIGTTRFEENWPIIEAILKQRYDFSTHREVIADWPADRSPPSSTQLYEWLSKAAERKFVVRLGSGTKNDPFRFRLPEPSDPELDAAIDEILPKEEPRKWPRSQAMRESADLARMDLGQLARHYFPPSKEDLEDMPPRGIGPFRKE